MVLRQIATFRASASKRSLSEAEEEARAILEHWNRGASPHSVSVRRSALALFGAHAWGVRGEIAVMRRLLDLLRADLQRLRVAVGDWLADLGARGLAARTIASRAALVQAAATTAAHVAGLPRVRVVPRPDRGDRPTASVLLAAGLARDAAIVELSSLGWSSKRIAALNVRDAAALDRRPILREALRATVGDRRASSPLFVGASGRRLAASTIREILAQEIP